MAWQCSQCGEINENESIIRCTCGHEMTQEEQNKPIGAFVNVKSVKTTATRDIIIAGIPMFVLSGVLSLILPKNDFVEYYAWIAVQCLIIYELHKKHPLILLAVNKNSLQYGLSVGALLLGFNLFRYVTSSINTPADYTIFINYSAIWKSLFILNAIVLAPVVEEILFRGFFYRILRDRHDIFWGALISILLFGAVHNFDGSSFLFGLIFTFIYEKTETVWGSMLAHALNNIGYGYFHYIV